jgi:hypothetical protein
MKRFTLAGTGLAVILLAACDSGSRSKVPSKVSHTDAEAGVKITFPANFRIMKNPPGDTHFTIAYWVPKGFSPVLDLVTDPVDADTGTSKEYSTGSFGAVSDNLSKPKVVSPPTAVTIDGVKFYMYSLQDEADKSWVARYIGVHTGKKKVYIFTIRDVIGSKRMAQFEAAVRSVKFVK